MELEESVRTISALFSSAGNGIGPNATDFGSSNKPLEARVADISAEIAAAIAQAQARAYADEDEESGSGQELSVMGTIGPTTSGIRDQDGDAVSKTSSKEAARIVEEEFEDDDSDAFPVPLRTRKTKAVGIGTKRKR
jgi:methionine synthase I (cobalamin-dependent)